MTPTETVSRLRRLADDWRKEERQLCEQFGNEIIPHSMRARKIKDTKAIGTAVEMIERMEKQEPVGTLHDDGCFVWRETAPHQSNYAGWKMALYAGPGAKGEVK